MASPHLKVHDSYNARYENNRDIAVQVLADIGWGYRRIAHYCSLRPVPRATYDFGSDTWHVLQPSHSHLCGYEDFSNASVFIMIFLQDLALAGLRNILGWQSRKNIVWSCTCAIVILLYRVTLRDCLRHPLMSSHMCRPHFLLFVSPINLLLFSHKQYKTPACVALSSAYLDTPNKYKSVIQNHSHSLMQMGNRGPDWNRNAHTPK